MTDDLEIEAFRTVLPRHVELAKILIQGIKKGEPAVGDLLPTEAELCATWGLSRYAVRQAIQKLCDLGLVSRQAGVGTRVVSTHPQNRYVQTMDALSDLARYAQGTELQLMSRAFVTTDVPLATQLRGQPGEKWLHINGVRYGAGDTPEPIALVDIYVASAYSLLPSFGKTLSVPVYTMLEQQFGIKVTRVEQEFQGWLIDGTTAETLQVSPGTAGLKIIRTYFVGESVVEVTTGIHPASRHSYSMTFNLSQSTS